MRIASARSLAGLGSRSLSLALFPGSFNPLHDAHRRLRDLAESILSLPVAFELSVANVDKPVVGSAELKERLDALTAHADVWLTWAPRFVEKSKWFPGAWFLVGADTAARLLSAHYYPSPDAWVESLRMIRDRGCRFLVAARVDSQGKCWEMNDLTAPVEFRDLFCGISAELFRMDLSSSALRGRSAP